MFETFFHNFVKIFLSENGFPALLWKKLISVCWKIFPVPTGKIPLSGKVVNVCNIFGGVCWQVFSSEMASLHWFCFVDVFMARWRLRWNLLPKERYGDSLSGRGSNSQPSRWEAETLPLSYHRPDSVHSKWHNTCFNNPNFRYSQTAAVCTSRQLNMKQDSSEQWFQKTHKSSLNRYNEQT